MKGIYLEAEGRPPVWRTDLPEPELCAGGVIVRLRAVPVLSYTRDVLSGKLKYVFPAPFIPGNSGVGVVERVADDVFDFKPGEWVSIDPRLTAHSTSKPEEADSILIGLTASTPESQKLQARWRHGSYAEKALVPAECLTRIDAISAHLPEKLALLSHLAVPYGGLLRAQLRAGETVVINGATGLFGTRGVVVALAIGAAKVIPVGRDEATLATLCSLDPRRVRSFALSKGPVADQAGALRALVGGRGADVYLDMLGRAQEPDSILVCLGALRHRGRAVLMGGVRIPIPFDYAEIMRRELTLMGNFMYPRHAPRDLVAMVESGTIDLGRFEVATFPLAEFDQAMTKASECKGLKSVAVLP